MAGIKIVDLPPLGRDLASTDLLELSLAGGTGSRKITGQEIMNTSKLNIGTTAITSGTVGRVLFQGTGNVVQESANLFWDATNNRLGIGTSSPLSPLDVVTSAVTIYPRLRTTSTASNTDVGLRFQDGTTGTANNKGLYVGRASSINYLWTYEAEPLVFGTNNTERVRVFGSTGNVAINTTTDAGFRLDVNGTARVSGLTTLAGTMTASGAIARNGLINGTLVAAANNDALVGLDINPVFTVNTSFVNTSTSLRINANYAPPSWSGNNNQYGIDISPTFRDSNVSIGLRINPNFINISSGGAWALSIENTGYGAIRQTSTATPNIFAGVTSIGANISGNTGFSLNVSSSIKVGTVNSTGQHLAIAHSEGGATFSSIRNQFTSTSAQMLIDVASQGNLRLFGTGNVAINSSTDAGFKLDVNGTARVSGNFTVASGSNMLFGTTLPSRQTNSAQYPAIFVGNSNSGLFGETTTGYKGINLNANIVRDTSLFWVHQDTAQPGWVVQVNYDNLVDSFQVIRSAATAGTASFVELFSVRGNGNVLINTTTNIASAQLNVSSTTKGFLPPRMTQTQRNAIASPAIGLEIYQTDATEGKYIYKSSGWTYIG